VFHSWGLAIIGLTALVRLCLHPLNRKQQASMMRYQKKVGAIKPQMDALKEKYGSNRMKMNQEMQKLFKEHGINPAQMMGGCLMIFAQLPVWFALYRSIEYSLDLRHAPFLWITDLTKPDNLLTLPFSIPFLGNMLNILPILYVILTITNQKMQPKPADPQMAKQMQMMSFMMVFFGFIFYSFPAGFLLYFIASAGISMAESRIIKKILAREGLGPLAPANAQGTPAGPGPKKSGPPQAMYASKKIRGEKKKKKKKKPF
jgi:YidC/Oxa1 family membrane protein insertase